MLRMQATARKLVSWSARSTDNVRQKMALSHELLMRLDKAHEDRALSTVEDWLR